ncbi:6-bladed beta-propeller [Parabacteroides bouchesdurhonensis]|uniref:6-bladed beta-propeller n=1 Tax=Parabacteroides bouchesdurhonensis TaxID=1936995 RepID=UPI000C85BB57|nr:6-bladed beta-propeller [Parabacteroides bouchesdurhonensis]
MKELTLVEHMYKLYIIIFIFLLGCTNTQKENIETSDSKQSIPQYEIASNINISIKDTFKWNSIAKKYTLLPLETKEYIGASSQINYLDDSLIIIIDNQTQSLFYFDMKGDLKKKFNKTGNGPGEYQYLSFSKYNKEDSTLLIFDNGNSKILKYSFNNDLIYDKKVNNKSWKNICFSDNTGHLYTKNISESKALISVLNDDLSIKCDYLFFDTLASIRTKTCIFLQTNKSNTVDKFLINEASNDTVYEINSSCIKPFCIIKKENHAIPVSQIDNFLKLPPENDYILYSTIDAFSSYMLYRYLYKGVSKIELWSSESNEKIANSELRRSGSDLRSPLKGGFKFEFNTGNSINILPSYVSDSRLAFLIPAEECLNEIEGVKEDDNPLLLLIDLK